MYTAEGRMTLHTRPVNEITQNYHRDGYVVVDDLLAPDECDALKSDAASFLKTTPGASVAVGASAQVDRFRRLASDGRVVSVLSCLMPDGVAFMSDKLVFKSAAARFATPWHVDAWYWPNTRPKLSVWIALDRVRPENGALVVLPGSHLRQWKSTRSDARSTNGEFVQVIEDKPWRPEEEVICALSKGGAIFFSDRLLHASTPNIAGEDRFALISTYHAPQPEEPFDQQFPARHVIVPARHG
jgi:phytanoyl-CoA hydroxylase